MSNRKLNHNRLLVIISIPTALVLITLVGWGLSRIPAKEGFWLVDSVPDILECLFIGAVAMLALVATLIIIALTALGICYMIEWIYPKVGENSNE